MGNKNKKVRYLVIIFSIIIFICICGLLVSYLTIKPKIQLNGESNITLEINSKYDEKNATAKILNKNVSKDIKISSNLKLDKIGNYVIKYTIKNKYLKKSASVTRNIKIIDSELPKINLKGNDTINLYVGDKYKEPGYTATDNYDGDITDKVIIKNNINEKKKGTYEVTYTISDSSNNTIQTIRKINIKEKPVTKINSVSSKKSGNGLPVLMYHYFYDSSKGETGKDSNWMDISKFESQVKYLTDNNYYFPSWDEIYKFVDGKIKLPKKSVVITIDDGHKSLFNKAIPIIEKYNAKATAFVITADITDAKLKYRSENISFQCHTHDMHHGGCSGGHGGIFRCINYDKGLADLKKSIKIIGTNDAIAYPYGETTDNILKITKASGIKLGFTTNYGKVYSGMNKYKLPRVRMSKGISLAGFKNSL